MWLGRQRRLRAGREYLHLLRLLSCGVRHPCAALLFRGPQQTGPVSSSVPPLSRAGGMFLDEVIARDLRVS